MRISMVEDLHLAEAKVVAEKVRGSGGLGQHVEAFIIRQTFTSKGLRRGVATTSRHPGDRTGRSQWAQVTGFGLSSASHEI
jgi:hypothetical protein